MAGSSTSRVTSNIRYFRSLFFPLPLVDFFSQISCRERWHVREGRNWNFFRRWRLFELINQLSNLTISAFEHNTLSNHCFSSRILFFFFFQISRIYPPAKTPPRSPKFTNFTSIDQLQEHGQNRDQLIVRLKSTQIAIFRTAAMKRLVVVSGRYIRSSNLNLPVYSGFNQPNVGWWHAFAHLSPPLLFCWAHAMMPREGLCPILGKLFRDSSLIH